MIWRGEPFRGKTLDIFGKGGSRRGLDLQADTLEDLHLKIGVQEASVPQQPGPKLNTDDPEDEKDEEA